jgi:hypothetical protein
MQFLSGVITESEYKAKLEEATALMKNASKEAKARDTEESDREYIAHNKKRDKLSKELFNKTYKELSQTQKSRINNKLKENKDKSSLNEGMIGGIVGVGAINNPFEGRKKEKYEDAFEYFLSSKYSLKEEEEKEVEEGKEVEEPSLYEGEEPLKDISDEEKAEYLVYMTGMDYNEALMKVRQS